MRVNNLVESMKFVKMLSMMVALVDVTLVGLFIVGTIVCRRLVSRNEFVGGCVSDFTDNNLEFVI